MSRKKGIPLDQFLKPDTNITNWAEEDEDLGPEGLEAPPFPAAPKYQSAEPAPDSNRESSDLPDQPPWKVYIGNVPYELTPRDIEDVFRDMQIRDTHMLTHRDSGKLKGVFVEFGSKSDLQSALQQNGVSVLGRSLRIDVAEAKPERSRGFSDRGPADSRDRGGYGFDRPDYSSGNRLDERRSSGYSRDYEGDRGRGSGFDSYGSRGYDQREDRRGFGSNYDQDERRGSFRDRPKGDYGGFSGARDEGSGRWGRAPTDAPSGGKNQELSGLESMSSEHKSLTLQPTPSGASATSDGPPKPKANPFGNAKPVDTVAKLKELEERDAKRKAEEATRRRDAAAMQRQTPPEPTPAGPSLPTKILQPTGHPQAGSQPAFEQPSQEAPASAQQQPLQGPAASMTAERQQPPQAIASKPKAIPSPAAAPAAQQLPRPSAEPAPAAAARAPAWGKPAQPSKAMPSQAAHEPPADAPQRPQSTARDQTNQASKSSTITESDRRHAEPQPPTQSSRQLQAEQLHRPASQQAQQGQAKPPGFDGTPGAPTAASPKSAWGKPSRVEGGSQPNPKPGSTPPQPSAWGKGQSQTAAPHSTQNGSHAASDSRVQETSSQKQQQQSAKQEQPPAEPAGQAGTTGQQRPIQAQAAKPSNAWVAPRQGNNANQSHHAATGTQFGSLDAADLQPPAAARHQTAENRPGPHSRRDVPAEQQQQQGQISKASTAEWPVSKNSAPAPASAETQDPEQGWTDVASTRGAAGQDGAPDSSEAGRGRGGRGRGRGRYSNAGPVDSFRGRGPGRGRGYGNQGGRGGPAVRAPAGRGPPGRGYQGAPPPGLQQGAEVEQGWEQAGRSDGSRANRGRGRGSSAPQILQHQDRPTNAWGQQGSGKAPQQHDGKAPPGLASQPESKATEAQNMFELLNEGADT